MMSAPVWLVRHAPVAVPGLLYGHADVPTLGDAESSARCILVSAGAAGGTWDEIWASPSVRTRTIATVLAQELDRPLRLDERLRELHFGQWEGRSFRDIERENPELFRAWCDRYETSGPPGGESAGSLRRRVEAWLVERWKEGRPVLAVTHAGVIRTARAIVAGSPYAEEALRDVLHLSVERLAAGPENSTMA